MVPAAATCVVPAPHSHLHRPCRSHTTTAGRSSCRVSWFMAVCRGSKMGRECAVVQLWRREAPSERPGHEQERKKEKRRDRPSGASRDSNWNKKKPGGGIEPPQRHQPRALSTGSARKFGELQVHNSSSGVAWASPTCPNGGCGGEAASPEPAEFAPRGIRVPELELGRPKSSPCPPLASHAVVRRNSHGHATVC